MDRVTALLIREPSGVERLVTLGDDAMIVGRQVGCDVRLDSPYVSPRHARIEQQSAGAVVVDLDSLNGCFVNDCRVSHAAPIGPGDVIGIADVSIRCLARVSAEPEAQRYDGRPSLTSQPAAAPPPGANGHPMSANGALLSPSEVVATAAAVSPGAARVSRRAADALRVHARTHEVLLGQGVPEKRLSAQEFKLLVYLYEHRDRVCTRQELGDSIWNADNWDLNMLYRLVHRLKDKIEPGGASAEKPRYVQTVPQIGYRLTP